MSIFKKNEKIEIIVPLEGNLSVQAFADKHAKPNTSIEVEVHGSLYRSSNNLVSVRGRKPVVGRRLMFCN